MPEDEPAQRPDRAEQVEPPVTGELLPSDDPTVAPSGEPRVPVRTPAEGTPPPPRWVTARPTGFRAWWARPTTIAGMFALVLLLLVALAVVAIQLANRSAQPPVPTPSPSPSPRRTEVTEIPRPTDEPIRTTGAATPPPATPGATPAVLPPAPIGPGERYVTGSHELSQDDSLDLDDNDAYSFTAHNVDFVVFADGLGGNGGTVFVRWPGTGRPLLSDCAAKPAPEWSPHVPRTEIAAGATFCVISDQGRYGYLLIQRATSSEGSLRDVSLNFLLWKKQSDD